MLGHGELGIDTSRLIEIIYIDNSDIICILDSSYGMAPLRLAFRAAMLRRHQLPNEPGQRHPAEPIEQPAGVAKLPQQGLDEALAGGLVPASGVRAAPTVTPLAAV